MASDERRARVALLALSVGGGFLAVSAWVLGGFEGMFYIVLGTLILGAGFMRWHGRIEYLPHVFVAAGVLALVMSAGRAAVYGPTNGLAIALFVLSAVLCARGYQYYQAR